jgi:hypothetical protein
MNQELNEGTYSTKISDIINKFLKNNPQEDWWGPEQIELTMEILEKLSKDPFIKDAIKNNKKKFLLKFLKDAGKDIAKLLADYNFDYIMGKIWEMVEDGEVSKNIKAFLDVLGYDVEDHED